MQLREPKHVIAATERYNSPRPIDIVVPCYRNAPLVTGLFRSIGQSQAELTALRARVIAINDSPDDGELCAALDAGQAELEGVPVEVLTNQRNLGFVRSVNAGLRVPVADRHDVLLLNTDTVLSQGAVREMAEVAYLDPMIGFVSPRSNNATLCSLPHQAPDLQVSVDEAYASFRILAQYLPRYRYVPVGVGFCLFIKAEVITEFGVFDETYGYGYNEENDLMMRANRCGYRAALANWAFVYHAGGASFKLSEHSAEEQESRNASILSARYPEYWPSVQRYFRSAEYEAEGMLTALLPYSDGRLDLVFDFSRVGTYYCGTFEVAKRLLVHASEQWRDRFQLHVLATEQVKVFHELDKIPGLLFVAPETTKTFAVAICPSQPFERSTLSRMSTMGVLNFYVMLDTIAYDCLHLNTDELSGLWSFVMQHANGVVYISDFVRQQFNRRFERRPGLKEVVAYPSMATDDYRRTVGPCEPGSHLLVIGNKFEHKRVRPTVEALARALPLEKIVVIGIEGEFGRNVVCYPSGNLSDLEIDGLYANARVLIYPSLYEGFGIPVVKALSFKKPVLARRLPVMTELKERIPEGENLVLYSSTEDLIHALRKGPPVWTNNGASAISTRFGWREAVDQVGQMLDEALAEDSLGETMVRRIERLRQGAVQRVDELIVDQDKRVADIYGSWSWKLTAPLRSVGALYLRFRKQ